MITVRFRCGHEGQVGESAAAAPCCAVCGETRVQQTRARAPIFRGTCTGPYAEYKALEAGTVNVAPAGPLVLKQER